MRQFLFLFAIIITISTSAQNGVKLEICDLPITEYEFPKVEVKQALEGKFGTGIEAWSGGDQKTLSGTLHPFVEAVHNAYAMHRPLVISPDMIWLMIAQGFAKHVDVNGDSLRHFFVDFEGKKVLKVSRNSFVKGSPDNDWEGVFPEFSQKIAKYTGEEVVNDIVLDFSTTGHIEKAAMEVTLMDAMSSYFIYVVEIGCGITEVNLQGTTADWQLILDKTKKLEKYELKWWTDALIPVLEKFVEASKGKVDKSFWEQIYIRNTIGCGTPVVSGWITKFFPYQQSGILIWPERMWGHKWEEVHLHLEWGRSISI